MAWLWMRQHGARFTSTRDMDKPVKIATAFVSELMLEGYTVYRVQSIRGGHVKSKEYRQNHPVC